MKPDQTSELGEVTSFTSVAFPTHSVTSNFLEWSWAQRESLTDSGKLGLRVSLIVFLNACLEGFVANHLECLLREHDAHINRLLESNVRTVTMKDTNGVKSTAEFSLAGQAEMFDRIRADYSKALRAASFGNLNRLSKLIQGKTIKEVIPESYESWEALNSFRNLVAHGREMLVTKDNEDDWKSNFEKVCKALKTSPDPEIAKLGNEHLTSIANVLNEDTAIFFHSVASKVIEEYKDGISQLLDFDDSISLPNLVK